jgi:hypothetical protein
MTLKEIYEWDKKNFERLSRFQLSHKYKNPGILLFAAAFIGIFVFRFVDSEPEWIRMLLKNVMILGLLMVSISKEKIEDEFIIKLRQQSYQLAFITCVIYYMVQPMVSFIADLILNKDVQPFQMGYVGVLTFMLLVQLGFFWLLLRKCR